MSAPINKVLLADDDESVRKSLCKLLHGEGYEVVSVANGTEAIETFSREKNQFDLLMVDLNMPSKNGWATLDRLLEVDPSLPVLIVTGQSNQYELAEAAGVNALVEKPIDVPVMLQLIDKLLAGSGESPVHHLHRRELPFQFIGAASPIPRYPWAKQHLLPHPHGGLNE